MRTSWVEQWSLRINFIVYIIPQCEPNMWLSLDDRVKYDFVAWSLCGIALACGDAPYRVPA